MDGDLCVHLIYMPTYCSNQYRLTKTDESAPVRPDFSLRSSSIRDDLLSYNSKLTDIRQQTQEKFGGGVVRTGIIPGLMFTYSYYLLSDSLNPTRKTCLLLRLVYGRCKTLSDVWKHLLFQIGKKKMIGARWPVIDY